MLEWDVVKNSKNKKKHGITFEEAKHVFDDPFLLDIFDKTHSTLQEYRYIAIGDVGNLVILTVAFVDKNGKKRIISARKASPKERSLYYGNLKKTLGAN